MHRGELAVEFAQDQSKGEDVNLLAIILRLFKLRGCIGAGAHLPSEEGLLREGMN